ncbi:hypothetical protein BXZ70DRAFT_8406 [Cristinia sonorae]|uniref:Uncharacterized protein n=1 Tax=Cristinia sonorae TaxID=1940300 RepID=A0A8K0UZB5_9AGAR|nr:hypothetical protein BXZ70DRAFT_8406 [Cristinia sonorae]
MDPLTIVANIGNVVGITANTAVTIEALKSTAPGKLFRSKLKVLNKDTASRNFRRGQHRAGFAITMLSEHSCVIKAEDMRALLSLYDFVSKEERDLEILIPQTQSLGVFNRYRIKVHRRSETFDEAAESFAARVYNTSTRARAESLKLELERRETVAREELPKRALPSYHPPHNGRLSCGMPSHPSCDRSYASGYTIDKGTEPPNLNSEIDSETVVILTPQDPVDEVDIALEDSDSQVFYLKQLTSR